PSRPRRSSCRSPSGGDAGQYRRNVVPQGLPCRGGNGEKPRVSRDARFLTGSGDTPPALSVNSGGVGFHLGEVMRPRGRLVVARSRGEASVENADPAVGELPDRRVVSFTPGAQRV